MNCALCKGKLKKGIVNHIVDLGDGIIIIKKMFLLIPVSNVENII